MFKLLVILLVAINVSFAQGNFKKFDIVEIKSEGKQGNKKKQDVKYGIVLSSDSYNTGSKYLIIVPMIHKKKDYKGAFVYNFKSGIKEYTVFTDKPRSLEKSRAVKSSLMLKDGEKKEILSKFNDILN
jgi:hypothetical protein